MTYTIQVPNDAQSPGLFPTQNNTNFQRLFAVFNADHKFNLTAASDDGFHRQVSLINRANPGSLPAGASALLYSRAQSSGNELQYFNNVSRYRLTPTYVPVKGQETLAPGGTTSPIELSINSYVATFVVYRSTNIDRNIFGYIVNLDPGGPSSSNSVVLAIQNSSPNMLVTVGTSGGGRNKIVFTNGETFPDTLNWVITYFESP